MTVVSTHAPTQTITVIGTGKVSGLPDRLLLDLGIEVRRPTAPHAYLRAAEVASRVFDALAALALPGLTRATRHIGLRAEILWGDHQEQRVSGYVASQELTVTLSELGSASAVLDAVVTAGADDARINAVTFGFSDPDARSALAQEAAWEDARSRASRWAELAGCTLGEVEEVSEITGGAPRPFAGTAVLAETKLAEQASMPIEPGEADTVCTVTVRWRVTAAG